MYQYSFNYTCPECKSHMVQEIEWNENCSGLQCDHCKHLVVSESNDYWYRSWITEPYGVYAERFLKQMIDLLEKESNQHLKPENIALTMKMWMDNTPRDKFLR